MKKRFQEVAAEKGTGYSTYIRAAAKRPGVYIIRSKRTKKPVYIGYSGTNLYKTITRHFQSWDDPTQVRTVYENKGAYQIRIVITRTPARAEALERALIVKFKPRDNPNKLEMYQSEKDLNKAEKKELKSYLDGDQLTPVDDIPF
jgi:predicted GIY-YIG superfamily endonuclease